MDFLNAQLQNELFDQRPASNFFDGPQDGIITAVVGRQVWFTVPDFDTEIAFGPATLDAGTPAKGDPIVVVFVGTGVDKPRVVQQPNSSIARSVADVHSDVVVVNTTAYTTLASFPIPTTVAAGDFLRMTAWGDYENNSGASATTAWRVQLGAASLVSGAVTVTNTALRRPWSATIDVLVVSATNDQRVSVFLSQGSSATSGWIIATTNPSGSGRVTATEDLTAGTNLQLSVAPSVASASFDVTLHEAVLEIVKR